MAYLSSSQCRLHANVRIAILALLVNLYGISSPGMAQGDWRLSGFVDRKTDSLFETKVISYGIGEDQVEIPYRLYIPDEAKSGNDLQQKCPLLVWLHGYGEAGENNREHLRWMNLLFGDKHFPGFVMAYQCPTARPTWSDGSRREEQPMTIARTIIDELLASYPIDSDRIYVSGVSSGGTGCWQMILRYPELFAAAVPIASSGAEPVDLQPIAHIPIWAFHAREDPESSVIHVRNTVTQLQNIKGKAYLTETTGYTHNCWSAAFGEFRFVDWLLTQRKGKIGPVPDYWRPGLAFRLALQPLQEVGVQYYLPIPVFMLICWYVWRTKSKQISKSKWKAKCASIDLKLFWL
jgi:predicted esterase